MRFHEESRRSSYDAVVIGSGIGGLSAAALLVKAGLSTLVVERHDRVGGYAHAFRRSGCLFDSAVHLVGGCRPATYEGGGLLHQLLSVLGLRERLDFAAVDPFYTALHPGSSFAAPADLDEYQRVLVDRLPEEAKGLRQLLHECLAIRHETRRAAELASPVDVLRCGDRFPTLLRYRRATLEDVFSAHLESREARAWIGAPWPFLGLPPSQLSFLYFSTMLMSYVADGTFYCRGSFQRLADSLARAVEEGGGEVLLRSTVRRIRVEGGRARGVVLENGQSIEAPIVLSNADARQTFEELVGESRLPARSLERLRRLEPSISAFVVYAALRGPLPAELGHETFLYDSWDADACHASSLAGEPDWLTLTLPSLADPGLAPPGDHVLVLTTLVSARGRSPWSSRKEALARRLLERVDRRFPGLVESIRFFEPATPRTLERYTRNTDGAVYGWAHTPAQVGPGRPSPETPIAGLSLVGHWAQPGGGIYGVVASGIDAARRLLGYGDEASLWRALSAERRSAP